MNTINDPENGKFMGIGRKPREITRRVVITGKLTLETPAGFGNGDVEGLTDMPLLRDPLKKVPLLTGTSIAGAMRNHLREIEMGYGKDENPTTSEKFLTEKLFGHLDNSMPDKKASVQSWLLIDDALGETPGVEVRDGVAIDPKSRTAAEKKKFDFELLAAGTTFDLSFELPLGLEEGSLQDALVFALHGLEEGGISLGQRKKRGLGKCKAGNWSVCTYDLTDPKQLIEWLDDDRSRARSGENILELLPPTTTIPDQRDYLSLEGEFMLESSLLIRSGSGEADSADMVHLRSKRTGEEKAVPILSGTSLAGAVRARALRIANTIVPDRAAGMIDEMFGKRIEGHDEQPTGSRVVTSETRLFGTRDLVQSRVKIDRFTGGSFPLALFTQQPEFGGEGSKIKILLGLHNPKDGETGLLLLVLKDLWTGDLPLGGESSVGRGWLRGLTANITLREKGQEMTWTISQVGEDLEVAGSMENPRTALEKYVEAFHAKEVK